MSKDYLEQASERQKRYNINKKKDGYKKIQVYISDYEYSQLLDMKENKKKTFSEIVSAGINCKYRTWAKYKIYKK